MSESGTAGPVDIEDPNRKPTSPEKSTNGNETSRWVKFDGGEDKEAATIQPTLMEVIAVKETGDKKAKDRVAQSAIRIDPAVLRPSPPRSPVIQAPPMSSPYNIGLSALKSKEDAEDKLVNGDVICTVLPTNKSCAWVTRAKFQPNLVPEEIMDTSLTITVEDYVLALQVLTNDLRFTLYNVFYKRILLLWMMLGFVILISLLFTGTKGLALFAGGVLWLVVNATGIFVCMWLKFKLYHLLERCMAHVNTILLKHNIILGLDDRGKLSCHKVHLIFINFETEPCLKYLASMLENQEKADSINQPMDNPIVRSRMDLDHDDIIITRGSATERVTRTEKTAEKLFLRYSQRWVKEFVRKRLDLSVPVHPDGFSEPAPPAPPRHCAMARCPCQFIEEHLRFKPLTKCSWSELCC
ncbi:uncharacterized protein LOC100903498 [Galendromus occidentalis]|uniref:Uncharacterized protein LOC100903498 n=1 Tax=Galendromus occidentalis TaxID=34638 RepID=A0AAJ6VWD0_9ACAR|nr:uncharacterized protein LOC100903498 [Galendromus occidentalis]